MEMDNTILSNEKSIGKMEKVPLKEILSDNAFSHNTDLESDNINSMQSGEGCNSEDVDQENTCPILSFTVTQDNIEDETSTSTSYKPRPSLLLNFDPLFCKNTPTRNCSLNSTRIHENDNIDSLTNQFSDICINKVDNTEDFQELQKKFYEEKNTTKRLEKTIKDLQLQIASLTNYLSKRNLEIQNYRQIMEEFETQTSKYYTAFQKLRNEHTVVTKHLTNLELAFSDVHREYEQCKKIIEGYKSNEDALVTSLAESENSKGNLS